MVNVAGRQRSGAYSDKWERSRVTHQWQRRSSAHVSEPFYLFTVSPPECLSCVPSCLRASGGVIAVIHAWLNNVSGDLFYLFLFYVFKVNLL